MTERVRLEIDGAVAVITNDNPEKHNAFDDDMDLRLFEIFGELAARNDIRAVVWRGEGKSFSSGRDTKELGVRTKGESDLEYIEAGHAKTALLWTMPVPIVVALKGWVLGGSFERALLCDMRIAADDARMGLPETAHGVMPDSGGAARIFQMAGHGLAADLALTGRIIDAAEALQHGLVSRVVPTGQLDETVMEVAREIAKCSPLAIKFAMNVIRGLGLDAVRRVMNEEKLGQTAIFASEDYQELKAARAENREPKFRGR